MEVKHKATAVQPFLPSRVLFCLFWGTLVIGDGEDLKLVHLKDEKAKPWNTHRLFCTILLYIDTPL
jgi:hypothetical protein